MKPSLVHVLIRVAQLLMLLEGPGRPPYDEPERADPDAETEQTELPERPRRLH